MTRIESCVQSCITHWQRIEESPWLVFPVIPPNPIASTKRKWTLGRLLTVSATESSQATWETRQNTTSRYYRVERAALMVGRRVRGVLQGCYRHVSWVLRIEEGFFRQRSGAEGRNSTRKAMEARAQVVRGSPECAGRETSGGESA